MEIYFFSVCLSIYFCFYHWFYGNSFNYQWESCPNDGDAKTSSYFFQGKELDNIYVCFIKIIYLINILLIWCFIFIFRMIYFLLLQHQNFFKVKPNDFMWMAAVNAIKAFHPLLVLTVCKILKEKNYLPLSLILSLIT